MLAHRFVASTLIKEDNIHEAFAFAPYLNSEALIKPPILHLNLKKQNTVLKIQLIQLLQQKY